MQYLFASACAFEFIVAGLFERSSSDSGTQWNLDVLEFIIGQVPTLESEELHVLE